MENFSSFLRRRFNKESSSINQLPPPEDLDFIMRSNGYRWHRGSWRSDNECRLKVSRSGSPLGYLRYVIEHDFHQQSMMVALPKRLVQVLEQPPVQELVSKCRAVDGDLAERVSYLLGGVAQHFLRMGSLTRANLATAYTARMADLGSGRSGEAITAALARYVISDVSWDESNRFKRNIELMAEAIDQDPIKPQETADLGLSQALRIGLFQKLQNSDEQISIPEEVIDYRRTLQQFPTIGGEFHLPTDAPRLPNFRERLALLNMSAYQPGSSIVFSRLDQDVVEIRMNPATFPTTIANWYLINGLVPEISRAYCTVTLGKREANFDHTDYQLITRLHTLAKLCYVESFPGVDPRQSDGQFQFGQGCFSMTVRVKDGEYSLTGRYQKDYQKGDGQLNLYTGFGDTFPHLAYYLSMATVKPALLEPVARYTGSPRTPTDLLETLSEENIKAIFRQINQSIHNSSQLHAATVYGQKVLNSLVP